MSAFWEQSECMCKQLLHNNFLHNNSVHTMITTLLILSCTGLQLKVDPLHLRNKTTNNTHN